MFCEECGSPLKEGAKSCHVCGFEIPGAEAATEEAAGNIRMHEDNERTGDSIGANEDNNEPQLIKHEAVSNYVASVEEKNAPEKSDLRTQAGDLAIPSEPNNAISSEPNNKETDDMPFKWDLSGFPRPRKTEEVNFSWNVDNEKDRDTGSTVASGESVPDLTGELDRYFSFDKSMEDFQKLLDRKYEKIKDSQPVEGRPHIERMNLIDRIHLDDVYPSFDDEKEPEPEAEPLLQARSLAESVHEVQTEDVHENDEEDEPEVIWISETKDIEIGSPKDEPSQPEGIPNRGETVPGQEEEEPNPDETVSGQKEEESARVEETPDPSDKTLNQDEETPPHSEKAPDQNEEMPAHAEKTSEHAEQAPGDIKETEKSEGVTEKEMEPVPLWFESKEEEVEVKKGSYIGRAVLIIIIALLLAEAAILGIQYFLPESNAAKKAGEINGVVIETLTEWKEGALNFFKGVGGKEETGAPILPEDEGNDQTGSEGQEGEDADKQPETAPSADKQALISAAADVNKNIGTVEANDSLTWQPGKGYAIADITDSKPIENNYWFTDPDGKHVYYDQEIVATLIDFDSKWVEYVNGGGSDVINLTKEGSRAHKNVTTFSKVGKVEQTFLLLQIGEIRQGQEAFYVWTYEEIKEVQGGKTSVKKYNWIYRLEPVDGKMKITDYYRY